jgi:hypothetical protein
VSFDPAPMSGRGPSITTFAASLAAAIVFSVSAAEADGTHAKSPKLYDWHAAAKHKEATRPSRAAVAAMRVGGDASYACSPSGFGKRAVCHRK